MGADVAPTAGMTREQPTQPPTGVPDVIDSPPPDISPVPPPDIPPAPAPDVFPQPDPSPPQPVPPRIGPGAA